VGLGWRLGIVASQPSVEPLGDLLVYVVPSVPKSLVEVCSSRSKTMLSGHKLLQPLLVVEWQFASQRPAVARAMCTVAQAREKRPPFVAGAEADSKKRRHPSSEKGGVPECPMRGGDALVCVV